MIFLSIGLPSRFTEWCDGMICALVQTALGPFECVVGNAPEEIAVALIKSRAPHMVVCARQPTEKLRGALIQTGRRCVVALDDPRAAVQHLITKYQLEWKVATRLAADGCAPLSSYAEIPNALVLRADQEGRDPIEAASAVARWLELDVSPNSIKALVDDQPAATTGAWEHELTSWWEAIPANDRAVADGALKGYIDHFGGAKIGQFVWARDLFLIGDDPHAPATRAIDIRGPVRNLLYGPYMTLPPGQWAATVALAVSKEAADLNYSVEILAGVACMCLGRGTIQPRGEGLCEATVEFGVSGATEQPIALRIANLQHAFDGRLALACVVVSPRLKTHADLPAELRTELGF